jgi:ankyrin repeat protein
MGLIRATAQLLMDENAARQILKAAKKGDVMAVRALLERDRSLVRVRDKDGSTPLHCAAWNGHASVASLLLDAGSDINDHNRNEHWGTTPLHAAAHGNQKEVAALLIHRGADLDARNLNGRTPLGETAVHNARAVAKLLVEHGAQV